MSIYYSTPSNIKERHEAMVEIHMAQMKELEKRKQMEQTKTFFDFGGAIIAMKQGRRVARKGWNGKGMCIFLIKGRTVEYNTFQSWKNAANPAFNPPEDIVIRDHVDMKAADGTYVTGWLASQTDMLAEDWFIV